MSTGADGITRRGFLVAIGIACGLGVAAALRSRPTAAPPTTGAHAAAGSTSTTATTAGPATSSPPAATIPATSSAATSTTVPPTTTAAPTTTTRSPARRIAILCRDAWGAAPPTGQGDAHDLVRLTVHHTAALLEDNRDAPRFLRGHQRFHQDDREWIDLAYHYAVDRAGNIYEGRPAEWVGDTGTNYDPTGHFLVVAEGDFDRQALPEAQLSALADVLAWGAAEFGIAVGTLSGHRDWASTSCPGDALYSSISDGTLAAMVEDRLLAGVESEVVCGADGLERVAAIETGVSA